MNSTPPDSRRSILLVDPNPDFLKALSRVFQGEGYEVVALPDPLSAIHYLAGSSKQFNLVISDLFVPKISGVEFLRLYKRACPSTPVFLLVAQGGWGQYREALEAGVTDCLCKPLSKSQLLEAVRRAVQNREKRNGSRVHNPTRLPAKSAKQKPIHA